MVRTAPFKVTHPERIAKQRYYDEAFFELERELLWSRVWQMACRLEEIPEIGDWVEYKILDQSVIIVRTKSGVKAFHNACRHRGVQLATGRGNCEIQGFICPFHGWRWNIEGQNTFVYARQTFSEDNLQAAEINLSPCRVEFWGGCAFINFDDDAAPLRECIKPVADTLDPRAADKMRSEWWLSTVLPTNWKLAMEAFMEGFHVMRTHPQLHEVATPELQRFAASPDAAEPSRAGMTTKQYLDLSVASMARLSEGMAGMCHANDVAIAEELKETIELPDDLNLAAVQWYRTLNDEITRRGRARGVPVPDLNAVAASHPTSAVMYMFPHYFLLPMFGNMSAYRIRPLTAETCLFELWSLTLFPEDEVREPPVAPVPMAHDDPSWPPIPKQDYANLPLQQLGLHARGFQYMRLAREIEGLISNYQRLIDGFIEGVEPDKLTKGQQVVCGGLDQPVKDIGF
jgi:phenylpropionate dioxygenase-like ring-hydroxylating dioxygenase large terminal subunit